MLTGFTALNDNILHDDYEYYPELRAVVSPLHILLAIFQSDLFLRNFLQPIYLQVSYVLTVQLLVLYPLS